MKAHVALQALVVIAVMCDIEVVNADAITYPAPATFATGDPLTASSLNNKFGEVKRAVDDNHSKLQNFQAGCATSGEFVTGMNSVGNPICTAPPASSVSASNIQDEPGLDFASSFSTTINGSTPGMTYCASTPAYYTLSTVSITAPVSGYVVVAVSGLACTHTANEYMYLALSNTSGGGVLTFDGNNYITISSPTARACGIGQESSYAFQNVYQVSAGTTNYYLKACLEASTTSANVSAHNMTAIFYPTRY